MSEQPTIDVLVERVTNVQEAVDRIEKKLDDHYVTQDQFEPIKRLVYGGVGLMLLAVFGALVKLVTK